MQIRLCFLFVWLRGQIMDASITVSTSTQTHCLLQKPLISPQHSFFLQGIFLVTLKTRSIQNFSVLSTIVWPHPSLLIHSWYSHQLTRYVKKQPKQKTSSPPTCAQHRSPQSQPSHWRSPSELLCHVVCSPLAALHHHHRCTPRTNSRGAPGRNWFRRSGAQGLATTNSHLWPQCTTTNNQWATSPDLLLSSKESLQTDQSWGQRFQGEVAIFFVMVGEKNDWFPPKTAISYMMPPYWPRVRRMRQADITCRKFEFLQNSRDNILS